MGGGITKLNSNAFTLIELLAIIVILAIIAVITVPIILNIIENSRKGASVDSAYGYKDSVQQYYLSQSVGSTTNEVLTINTVKTVSQLESDGLTVSGDKPSDGWVQLNKGQVVDYSLKFGDYVVSFDSTTNSPVATKTVELKAQPSLTDGCPGPNCVYYHNLDGYLYIYGLESNPEGAKTSLETGEYYESLDELASAEGYEQGSYPGEWLEFILDSGKIKRAFVCTILFDGSEYGNELCMEGYDTTKYDYNKSACPASLDEGQEGFSCSDDSFYTFYVYKNGNISAYISGSCEVNNDSSAGCGS